MDEQVGYIVVGVVLVFLLALVAGLFIGAVFLRWSVRILQGFRPPYGRALLVVFLATIASIAASTALVLGMQAAGLYDIEAMAAAATPDPQAMMAMMGATPRMLCSPLLAQYPGGDHPSRPGLSPH